MSLAHFCDVGSDGWIVRWSAFSTTSQRVSRKYWPNYQCRWMRHMSVPCGGSQRHAGNSPIECFSSSQWLPTRFTSRNWPTCSHTISRQDQYRSSMRIGVWKIQRMSYCLHVPLYLPLSTTKVPPSYNSHIFLSRDF